MKCHDCGAPIRKRDRRYYEMVPTQAGARREYRKVYQCGPCGDKDFEPETERRVPA